VKGGAAGHYIRPNESTRIPRRHICIDVETRHDWQKEHDVQRWRLGHAVFCEFTAIGKWRNRSVPYTDPKTMWEDITRYTRKRRRTVVWAHNLAFDMRASRSLECLAALGWELEDIRISSQGTWARWWHDDRTLLMADSYSVWPCRLDTLGAAVGVPKLPSPAEDDEPGWAKRCKVDAEILAEAVRRYTQWLREDDMGNWQLTGAGQSWANWRHRHMTHRVLISDDFQIRDVERRAMWTGRTEAWSYGSDPTGRTYDWDWENSYARICATVDLPTAQHSTTRNVPLDRLIAWTKKYCILAEVKVRTETPVVPTEHEGRIIWPVGEFATVLWDPELRLLAECGADTQIGRVWLYRKAPVLKVWAEWVMAELHKRSPETPAWLRIVLKHWSRALIGRFAMRYRTWEEFAHSEVDDIRTIEGWDVDIDAKVEFLQVGHEVRRLAGETEGADSWPALTGYVMSEARARLWRVAAAVGAPEVLYMDTDSLLVSPEGNRRLQGLAGDPMVEGLRLKRRFVGWQIAGPRQLVLQGEPRISGVPRRAVQVEPWVFKGEVWTGLKRSLQLGEADAVRITSRTFRIAGVDRRRVRDGNGRTEPIRLPTENAPKKDDGGIH
jgi:hypothetical protein